MTEQRPIVPPRRSLLERAEDIFGGGEFRPAPVPQELAANARLTARAVRKELIGEERPKRAGDTGFPLEPATVTEGRVEFRGCPVTIDRAILRANGLIQPGAPVSTLFEEFRLIKRQVVAAVRRGSGPAAQRVLVCSPLPGEGKTFCAVNLALAMAAERDSEVVLVDADFGKPSIPTTLGFEPGHGLMDALADRGPAVEDCIHPTDVPGLYVLAAGDSTAHDSEYLARERTREVLARLTRGAPNRIVIFDSPPALAASPASELASHVGQALVLCRADSTGMSGLEDALSLLSVCPDIKLILNAANFSPSGRRFGAYYGTGG